MSEIVKMQIREPDRRTGLVPDLPEVRPAQPPALGTDEDRSPLAGLRETAPGASEALAPARRETRRCAYRPVTWASLAAARSCPALRGFPRCGSGRRPGRCWMARRHAG